MALQAHKVRKATLVLLGRKDHKVIPERPDLLEVKDPKETPGLKVPLELQHLRCTQWFHQYPQVGLVTQSDIFGM
jgi:hypothetical protein